MKLSVRHSDIPNVLQNLYHAEWDPEAGDEDGAGRLLDAVFVTVVPDPADEFYGVEICLRDWFPLVGSDSMIDRVTELDIRLDALGPHEQSRLLAMLRPPEFPGPISASRVR